MLNFVEKRNISIHRIRLTVGDARGTALTDKCKKLREYCIKLMNSHFIVDEDSLTLVFKDLGPQISWKAVC